MKKIYCPHINRDFGDDDLNEVVTKTLIIENPNYQSDYSIDSDYCQDFSIGKGCRYIKTCQVYKLILEREKNVKRNNKRI